MASSNIFRNVINNFTKIIFILYLVICTTFYPLIAYSNTLSGWNINTVVRNGATTLYNASKTLVLNGSSVLVNSSATILPVASEVALMVARNATSLAVVFAVGQLVGAGIEYYNDVANKRFTYTPPDTNHYSYQYYYEGTTINQGTCRGYSVSTLELCVKNSHLNSAWQDVSVSCIGGYGAVTLTCNVTSDHSPITYNFQRFDNPNYIPNTLPPAETNVTYDDVANKIISNANAGNADAINYVGTVADTTQEANPANQIVKPQTVVNQFEQNINYTVNNNAGAVTNASSVRTEVTTGASGVVASSVASSVETATTNITLPSFCSYAPMLCDFLGWVKQDTLSTDNSSIPEFTPNNLPELDTNRVNFTSTCPAPISLNFTLMGHSNNISIEYTPLCDVLADFRWVIIAMGYIAGAYIIMGINKNGSE